MKSKIFIILVCFYALSCKNMFPEIVDYYTIEGFVKVRGASNGVGGIKIDLVHVARGFFSLSDGAKASAVTDNNGYYKIKYKFTEYQIDEKKGSLSLRMDIQSVPSSYVPQQYPDEDVDQTKVKIGGKLTQNFEVADKVAIKINIRRDNNDPSIMHNCMVLAGEYPNTYQRYYSVAGVMENDIRGSINQQIIAYTAGNGYVKIRNWRRIFAQPALSTDIMDSIYCVKGGDYTYNLDLR